jgi:hypothetical protein
LEPLSVEHIYFHAVQRMPGRDPAAGVALVTILEALRQDGQCVEVSWTYLPVLPTDLKSWMPPASATPVFKRSAALLGSKIEKVIEQVNTGIPVIIGLRLGLRFYKPVDGIVRVGPNDPDTGYHAVVAVGHGQIGKQGFILVRNSWAADWGMDGYAWVAADYLEPRLVGAATISKKGIV